MYRLFTSESVGRGHPDKACDQVSDRILDTYLREDPLAKVAVECAIKNNKAFILGEISSIAVVDVVSVASELLSKLYDGISFEVHSEVTKQSREIADAVHVTQKGAGDQGMVFGYATNETEQLLPLSLVLAHSIVENVEKHRKNYAWIKSDCKSQVTIEYESKGGEIVPLRVHTVVLSVQTSSGVPIEEVRTTLKTIALEVIPGSYVDYQTRIFVQPSGSFTVGGPFADAGLTGRKIVVDTYGGWGAHGGGAFSGKDATKVDRSGAYMARWIAISLVAAGLCKRVLVQFSYAIGQNCVISLYIDSYGTGDDARLERTVFKNFNLCPSTYSEQLFLQTPCYESTACYGHFGKKGLTWETPKKLNLEL